ncbi:hypothetical protein [Neobacillus dielmonensis]|uniref:hypothetical protein n=1 Tax=Neobacillus dielmonensis TaxID=1347369 RepID=UPI00069348B1|nr:hypothetical protein [Neobacillus dielmonensis]
MFRLFSNRNKLKEKKETNSDIDILTKLDRIIELLEKQQNKESSRAIHFDKVQIDHLENIVFHLDNLEIDTLSGKLIIGNHITSAEDFAESLKLKIDQESVKRETMADSSLSTPEKMVNTSKGYRFHYNSDNEN